MKFVIFVSGDDPRVVVEIRKMVEGYPIHTATHVIMPYLVTTEEGKTDATKEKRFFVVTIDNSNGEHEVVEKFLD